MVSILIISSISYLELPLTIGLSFYYKSLFTWKFLLPCITLYMMKECYCMSMCLHRYFAHKAFKCNRFTQFCLSCLGCLASQGSPLWWASKHRRHHKFCDTPKDPHSPQAYNKFYAWIGWIYLEGPLGVGTEFDYINDYSKYPELYILETIPWFPVYNIHYIFYHYYGLGAMIFVSMWSSILCQLLTLYFNVEFHTGNDDTDENCKAKDIPSDILSNIFGESYHKHHHKYPKLFKRPGIDLPYWTFIAPMFTLGIFY